MSEAYTWEEELLAPSVLQCIESILIVIYVICKAMQYIRCNSFFDHCIDQPDNIYKGYMWLLSYLRREYTGTRLSFLLCHICIIVFCAIPSVGQPISDQHSSVSFPIAAMRNLWNGDGRPTVGPSVKHVLGFSNDFTCSPESLGHCLLLQSPRSTRPVNCDQGWQTRGH